MPSNERIARPLILALILTVGLGVIWGALAIWIGVFAGGLLPSHYVGRTLSVLTDGTPYLSVYERGKGSHVENLEGEQVDLDGPESTINCAQFGTGGSKPRPWSWRQSTWRNRITMFNFSGRQDQHWYFIRDKGSKGTGYFVGYDTVNHQRIGYLGIDGWHEQCPASNQRFPLQSSAPHGSLGILNRYSSRGVVSYSLEYNYEIGWPSWIVAVRMGPRVDVVNLRDKTVQTVFKTPELLAVSTAQRPAEGGGSRDHEQLIAMRLPEKITFFTLEGGHPRRERAWANHAILWSDLCCCLPRDRAPSPRRHFPPRPPA